MSLAESMARHPSGGGPAHYTRYSHGAGDDLAKAAKREYVAGRRAAGLESMAGYVPPKVEHIPGRGMTILLRPTQAKIVRALKLDGADTETIARRAEVTAETVRRHLRVICRALGFDTRTELLAALLHGDVNFRERP